MKHALLASVVLLAVALPASAQDEGADTEHSIAATPVNGKGGFSFTSEDGAFVLRLRGYAQADARFWLDDAATDGTDTFLMRRVRPIAEGTLWKRFEFFVMPDFGGGKTVLYDAYVDAVMSPAFRVRAGKFRPPVGLEILMSSSELLFIERGLPSALVPNRDVGVEVWGRPAGGRWAYWLGVFNGVADGVEADKDLDDGKDLAARLVVRPWKGDGLLSGLGIGLGSSWGDATGTVAEPGLGSYKTPGQQTAFTWRDDGTVDGTAVAAGTRARLAPQLGFVRGPFEMFGEWTLSSQEVALGAAAADLEQQAWQLAAGWYLTGEKATLKSPTPQQPFDPDAGTWGAVELLARVHQLEVDPAAFPVFADPARSAERIDAFGVCVAWYLNRNVKLQIDYEDASFTGGGAPDRPDERTVFGRVQLGF